MLSVHRRPLGHKPEGVDKSDGLAYAKLFVELH